MTTSLNSVSNGAEAVEGMNEDYMVDVGLMHVTLVPVRPVVPSRLNYHHDEMLPSLLDLELVFDVVVRPLWGRLAGWIQRMRRMWSGLRG